MPLLDSFSSLLERIVTSNRLIVFALLLTLGFISFVFLQNKTLFLVEDTFVYINHFRSVLYSVNLVTDGHTREFISFIKPLAWFWTNIVDIAPFPPIVFNLLCLFILGCITYTKTKSLRTLIFLVPIIISGATASLLTKNTTEFISLLLIGLVILRDKEGERSLWLILLSLIRTEWLFVIPLIIPISKKSSQILLVLLIAGLTFLAYTGDYLLDFSLRVLAPLIVSTLISIYFAKYPLKEEFKKKLLFRSSKYVQFIIIVAVYLGLMLLPLQLTNEVMLVGRAFILYYALYLVTFILNIKQLLNIPVRYYLALLVLILVYALFSYDMLRYYYFILSAFLLLILNYKEQEVRIQKEIALLSAAVIQIALLVVAFPWFLYKENYFVDRAAYISTFPKNNIYSNTPYITAYSGKPSYDICKHTNLSTGIYILDPYQSEKCPEISKRVKSKGHLLTEYSTSNFINFDREVYYGFTSQIYEVYE